MHTPSPRFSISGRRAAGWLAVAAAVLWVLPAEAQRPRRVDRPSRGRALPPAAYPPPPVVVTQIPPGGPQPLAPIPDPISGAPAPATRAPSPFLPEGTPLNAPRQFPLAYPPPAVGAPPRRVFETGWNYAGLTSRAAGQAVSAEENVHIVASEQFLSRVLYEERTTEGDVRDFILGADVFGRQATMTRAAVDLHPSHDGARMAMVLDGVTRSNTVGVTRQAVVNTVGETRFRAVKEILFDGKKFSTRAPVLYADAQNQVVGAETQLSGVPLLGDIAKGIAQRTAQQRQPEAQAIARQRVAERVLPEFNTAVDDALRKANISLEEDVRKRLKLAGLLADRERFCTTDTHLAYSALLQGEGEQAGAPLPLLGAQPEAGLLVCVHESYLNNVFARLQLAGTTMSDQELQTLVEQGALMLPQSLRKPAAPQPAEEAADDEPEEPTYIVFDSVDPLTVQIRDGRLILKLRAGFEPPHTDPIPPQIVTISIGVTIEKDRMVLSSDEIDLEPVNADEAVPEIKDGAAEEGEPQFLDKLVRAVKGKLLRDRLQATLAPISLRRSFAVDVRSPGDLPVTLRDIRAHDGWLFIAID